MRAGVKFAVVGETHEVASVNIFHELVYIGISHALRRWLPEKSTHVFLTNSLIVIYTCGIRFKVPFQEEL